MRMTSSCRSPIRRQEMCDLDSGERDIAACRRIIPRCFANFCRWIHFDRGGRADPRVLGSVDRDRGGGDQSAATGVEDRLKRRGTGKNKRTVERDAARAGQANKEACIAV